MVHGYHSSKIHVESGTILLTLELGVKRLRRFDLPSADLDHAVIMGAESPLHDHCVMLHLFAHYYYFSAKNLIMIAQCWVNVSTSSLMLAQHLLNIGPTSRVPW